MASIIDALPSGGVEVIDFEDLIELVLSSEDDDVSSNSVAVKPAGYYLTYYPDEYDTFPPFYVIVIEPEGSTTRVFVANYLVAVDGSFQLRGARTTIDKTTMQVVESENNFLDVFMPQELTKSQVEDDQDDTFGLVSGERLAQAIAKHGGGGGGGSPAGYLPDFVIDLEWEDEYPSYGSLFNEFVVPHLESIGNNQTALKRFSRRAIRFNIPSGDEVATTVFKPFGYSYSGGEHYLSYICEGMFGVFSESYVQRPAAYVVLTGYYSGGFKFDVSFRNILKETELFYPQLGDKYLFQVANDTNSNRTIAPFKVTIDGNGFVKQSSPIIELHSSSIKPNSSPEVKDATLTKTATGVYEINNVTLLSRNGWYIETPKDRNNNVYFTLDYEEYPEDNKLVIKTYEPDYSSGRAENGAPMDIIEGRFVALRFEENEEEEQEQG